MSGRKVVGRKQLLEKVSRLPRERGRSRKRNEAKHGRASVRSDFYRAYRVAKHREGMYYYHQIRTTHGELIHELERRLHVQDSVIKYMTIRLDEDLKRQKKLTEKREKRAARRPRRPAAATPAAPAPQEQQASAN